MAAGVGAIVGGKADDDGMVSSLLSSIPWHLENKIFFSAVNTVSNIFKIIPNTHPVECCNVWQSLSHTGSCSLGYLYSLTYYHQIVYPSAFNFNTLLYFGIQ